MKQQILEERVDNLKEIVLVQRAMINVYREHIVQLSAINAELLAVLNRSF